MIALSAGGWRIAIWIELKPPQEMPHSPTLPFDQGCFASQAITCMPSCCSWSEYSRSGMCPSLCPVPRMSTRAQT